MDAYRNEMANRRQKWLQKTNSEPHKQEEASGATKANFSLVAGTELFNEQLQLIKPQIHIFGLLYQMNIFVFNQSILFRS
jgi:hypothetical protein